MSPTHYQLSYSGPQVLPVSLPLSNSPASLSASIITFNSGNVESCSDFLHWRRIPQKKNPMKTTKQSVLLKVKGLLDQAVHSMAAQKRTKDTQVWRPKSLRLAEITPPPSPSLLITNTSAWEEQFVVTHNSTRVGHTQPRLWRAASDPLPVRLHENSRQRANSNFPSCSDTTEGSLTKVHHRYIGHNQKLSFFPQNFKLPLGV